ncbi:MAG TPA: hypothetical protein PK169_03070, partial [Bacilli bacterium]|nr:hypothetical protein [Bacilli bacterium]
EFDFNKLDLKYPADLIVIIEKNLKLLLNRIDEGLVPFSLGTVLNDYNLYKAQKKQMEKRLERAKD